MSNYVGKILGLLLMLAGFTVGEEVLPKDIPIALSQPDEFYMAAQWSPTGEQVAAAGPSYTGLYILEFPTGNVRQISEAYAAGYGFAWSHDGTRIAARTASFENMRRRNSLINYDVTDGSFSVLVQGRTRLSGTPRWTKDDASIFLSGSDDFELFRLNKQAVLDENLVLVLDGQLVIRNLSMNRTISIIRESDRVSSYAVAPDQSRIVYSTMGQRLWIVNADGSGQRSLGAGVAPSWAPHGPWVVVMLTEDDGHAMLGSELYLVNVDTGVRRNISNTQDILEMNPQWSPDGSWILYDTEGQGQLFVQQMVWR